MRPAIIHRTVQAELTPSETLYTDSIDYLLGGALTLRNGKVDKYQFDEGYCQVSSSTSTTDTFILFYYEKDHLGNIRKVRKANRTRNGEVVQASNYYPFGAELCDNTANYSVQSRKYNGKEFDNMHGLNTYDYGARQYNPVTARWDRVDPLCEKYYNVSPYVYCMNNPVMVIDPNGKIGVLVHGTWSNNRTWEDISGLQEATKNLFNDANIKYYHSWSGKNASGARTSAAKSLVNMLVTELKKGAIKDDEAITLIGHSHGGNVNIEAINLMVEMKEFKGRPINLLTINTPVRDDYQLSIKAQGRVNHVNVYDPRDPVQISGGHSSFAENLPTPFLNIPIKQLLGETGLAGRTFSNAKNIAVNSAQGILDLRWIHGYEANSHSGMTYPTLVKGDFHNSHNRVSTWINKTK